MTRGLATAVPLRFVERTLFAEAVVAVRAVFEIAFDE